MPLPALIGLGASLLPNIVGLFSGGKQKREAKQAAQQAQNYFNQSAGYANQGLQTAQNQYSLAKQNYNGRMAGAGALEQNIYGNQSNTMAALGRNATNASQLLSLAGAVQGNTNDAFAGLNQMEAQDKQARFSNLAYANQGVQAQQNNLQNLYGNQSNFTQQQASQLGQAGQVNQFNALQGIGNAAMTFLPGMMGNKTGGGATGYNNSSWYQQAPKINYTLPGLMPKQNIYG